MTTKILSLVSASALLVSCGGVNFESKNSKLKSSKSESSSKAQDSSSNTIAMPEMKPEVASKPKSGPAISGSQDLGIQGQAGTSRCLISLYLPEAGGVYGCPAQPALSNALAADQVANGWYGFWDTSETPTPGACVQRLSDWKSYCFGNAPIVGHGNFYPTKDNYTDVVSVHVGVDFSKYVRGGNGVWSKL